MFRPMYWGHGGERVFKNQAETKSEFSVFDLA
jgi:hypothetical protein